MNTRTSIALLHGAGYVGGELIRLMLAHPHAELTVVTSDTFAGQPVGAVHSVLRGQTDLSFVTEPEIDFDTIDAVLIAGAHTQSVAVVRRLLDAGYEGKIVDLSADFRYEDPLLYERWFSFEHAAPEVLDDFVYGLPEVHAPYPSYQRFIANPGCFATALSLALYPVARAWPELHASVTALTGASGSGTRPKPGTHFPTRDGNVRAYKVLAHQHLPEVQAIVGEQATVDFVPVSGPWTRGIWGTAHIQLPHGIGPDDVALWYSSAYGTAPFVRLSPGILPELRAVVGTPFCDLGWAVDERTLVVGFAIDNLLKGAASQAIQNLNLICDWPETAGLLPGLSTFTLQEISP